MSKDSSAKHYQNDKESERYQSLSKEENKKKSIKMVINNTKSTKR